MKGRSVSFYWQWGLLVGLVAEMSGLLGFSLVRAVEIPVYPSPEELEHPATTVKDWLSQIEQPLVQIQEVRLMVTELGLEVILESSAAETPAFSTSINENVLSIDIPQASLALPGGDSFQAVNPAPGVAFVEVTSLGTIGVRVAITGVSGPPMGELRWEGQNLVLSVAPAMEEKEDIELVVTAETESYYVPNASTATGINTPIRDIPLSIQVVPQEVLEDRNVSELGEALETVGGVVSSGGRGTSINGPGFLIRGFEVNDNIFRDGITAVSLTPLSTNDIERVEVLKGPASVLFGQGEPGGIINLVSKKPLSEPFYSTYFTAGNFDTYRGGIDFSGPLNESRSVKYRLNLSYENYGSFRDFVDGERLVVSPTLTWEAGPNTSINFRGQYVRDRETLDEGIPASPDGIADVPLSSFFGEEFSEFEQDLFSVGYNLNHRFNDNLFLRHAFQFTHYDPVRFGPLFDSFDPETGILNRLEFFAGGSYDRFFTNGELIGEFSTGSIEHQVLFGVEYRHDAEDPEFQFSNLFDPINVFDPVFSGVPYAINPDFFRDDNVDLIGIYLQDLVALLPNLKILAGIRYDYVDQFRTEQFANEPRAEFEQTDGAFSPRIGIVYQPTVAISLYGSYTTSFAPSFGTFRNPDDTTFDPETGRQFEIGIKADLTQQLSLTLAAFDIRRQNVSTPDPNNPIFSVQTGEVASRGIELNLSGEILPGWNVILAYTYLDAFVSEDNTDIVDNQLTNVPDNQFSLWTVYEIQQGTLEGLGLGLGLFFLDDRPGNLDNTFELPSFFRTDIALFYERNNWRAQLNIENLFDVDYFAASDGFIGVTPGAPFTILGTIAVEF